MILKLTYNPDIANSQIVSYGSITEQFLDAISQAGMLIPDNLQIDGLLHRFNTTKGKRDLSGWYVAYEDPMPVIVFGDWKSGGEAIKYTAKTGQVWTQADYDLAKIKMEEAKKQSEALKIEKYANAKVEVEAIWDNADIATRDHPYLQKKQLKTGYCAKVGRDGRLIIPLYDEWQNLCSVQYISGDGEKRYHLGGEVKNKFCVVGDLKTHNKIFVAEGFATAATIYETTNIACVVAFSASGLVGITEILKRNLKDTKEIIIVADNDESGVGQKYADQASAKYGAKVILIPTKGDANDYLLAGNDLLSLLTAEEQELSYLSEGVDFVNEEDDEIWMIDGWLPPRGLVMLYGASGSGKTFVVLDMCMHIATSQKLWAGQEMTGGEVIYLAGEGHAGLKRRMGAWLYKYNQDLSSFKKRLWVSRSGCDLDKPEGLYRVVQEIRVSQAKPSVIVIDTLHRFLTGDENSAKDAGVMLKSCDALIREFDCCVILVHHTGVGESAQGRLRGSSSWRAAVDIEIMITKQDKQITISQKKSKDADLIADKIVTLSSAKYFDRKNKKGEQIYSAVIDHNAVIIDSLKYDKDLRKKQIKELWCKAGREIRPLV
jgi:putative DNA primase/helicase